MNGYCQEKHGKIQSFIKIPFRGKNGRRREKVYDGEYQEIIKMEN
jgi:2-iminoacetate synthase ThiH